jgi:hypothetical protein
MALTTALTSEGASRESAAEQSTLDNGALHIGTPKIRLAIGDRHRHPHGQPVFRTAHVRSVESNPYAKPYPVALPKKSSLLVPSESAAPVAVARYHVHLPTLPAKLTTTLPSHLHFVTLPRLITIMG